MSPTEIAGLNVAMSAALVRCNFEGRSSACFEPGPMAAETIAPDTIAEFSPKEPVVADVGWGSGIKIARHSRDDVGHKPRDCDFRAGLFAGAARSAPAGRHGSSRHAVWIDLGDCAPRARRESKPLRTQHCAEVGTHRLDKITP
jgi:hypothetical protein